MVAGMALSHRLWMGARNYPTAPVWDGLPAVAGPLDAVIFAVLLGLLVWIGVSARPGWGIAAFVVGMAGYCLFDQGRWQPWVYQYLVMLGVVGVSYVWPGAEGLNTCRLVCACIYFWSGVHKAQAGFVPEFRWLTGPVSEALPGWVSFTIPAMEVAIAVSLVSRSLRRTAVVAAVAMHVLILASIGPLGRGWNAVVWPWNVAMATMVALLFWRERGPLWRAKAYWRLVIPLFLIAPLASFAGLWDSYPSFALYSGDNADGTIYLSRAVTERLPEAVQDEVIENDSGVDELDVSDWSFAELQVPAYPEARVFRSVAKGVCRMVGSPGDMLLIIEEKRSWVGRRRLATYGCGAL